MEQIDDLWRQAPDLAFLKAYHGRDLGFDEASFPTEDVGYLVDLATRIFKTDDGGQRWRLLREVRGYDVKFVSATVGYVVGLDSLYRTEDGGATWQRMLVPLPLPGIGGTSYELLLLPHPGVTVTPQLVAEVSAWHEASYGSGQPPLPCTLASFVHTFWPVSDHVLWAKGRDCLVLSEDDGRHWVPLAYPWQNPNPVVRLDARLWYVATVQTEVYRSTDGGRSWQRRGKVGGAAGHLAFPTPEIGYTTGPIMRPRAPYGYGLYKTEDGGVTWRRLTTEVPGRAIAVKFLSATHGFVTGERGILMRTTDGGQSWTQATLPVKPVLGPVMFPTQDVGYVVGAHSTILKTIDGGERWTVLTHGSARFEKAFAR